MYKSIAGLEMVLSSQTVLPLGLELLSDEGTKGKVKSTFILGGVVNEPTNNYGTCYGLSSRGKLTFNLQLIREAHGNHFVYIVF